MNFFISSLLLILSIQLNAQMDTTSYSVGMVIAKNLKSQGITSIDQAIQDVFGGNPLLISLEEANGNFKSLIDATKSKVELANKQAGITFLETNGNREGVVTTDSGLQYEIIEQNDSGSKPGIYDKVKVHYHGTLIDGTVFDSSVERNEPISFPLNGVIQGWQEGLQLMSTGSKFRLYIPYDLGYGARAAGPKIQPYSALIFDVTLLAIE